MSSFNKVLVNKCYFIYHVYDPIECCYLHEFSDSSLSVCVVYIYLKSASKDGNVFVKFVAAKSGEVPITKSISIPCL